MINRLKILAKVDEIEDNECIKCPVSSNHRPIECPKCVHGQKLEILGEQLMMSNDNKKDIILEKGKDMTTNDVKYLLTKGMTRREVGRAIGLTHNTAIAKWFGGLLRNEPNKEVNPESPHEVRERRIKLADKIIKENNHLKAGEIVRKVRMKTGYAEGTIRIKIANYRKSIKEKE